MPVISMKIGSVKGKKNRASNGKIFYTFHGIPYAEPPVGALRFKAPQPVKIWADILDATVERDESYSIHEFRRTVVGSEDCLTLNVYTPTICRSDEKLPVMVWIHGGGFVNGSSKVENFGPDYFMCENVVLVTINYRLGIFGFLSFQDKSLGVPGNAGLKDQIMALRWVQEHISNFCGDAANVTVFGQSAGAGSIEAMLCSPMAIGLFHKVILQSGSSLNSWMSGQGVPQELLTYFNMDHASEIELLEVLMKATKEDLLKAALSCDKPLSLAYKRPFSPVIEGVNPREVSFLPHDPMSVISAGKNIKVPMIIGYNSSEGILIELMKATSKNTLLTDLFYAIPYDYGIVKGSRMEKTVIEKIQHFYFGMDDPRNPKNRKCFHDLATDTFFLYGIYQSCQCHVKYNPHAVYFYRFDVDAKLNLLKKLLNCDIEGACHADETFYMFKTASTPEVLVSSIEDETIKRFITFWTNFAKTSNPNGAGDEAQHEVNWLPTDGKSLLHFGDTLKMGSMPEIQRMAFWKHIDEIMEKKG